MIPEGRLKHFRMHENLTKTPYCAYPHQIATQSGKKCPAACRRRVLALFCTHLRMDYAVPKGNTYMNKTKFFALSAVAALALSANAYAAKEIKVASNNTPYSQDNVQKLAATAVSMGVKEPVSLNLAGGNLTISGSSATKCVFKVGSGDTPQIQGVNCK